METKQYRYVIIGGGVAAGYAARVFAEAESDASTQLCIISADAVLPYERPPLSKQYLAGEKSQQEILINDAEFYAENGIDVRLETVVGRVDLERKIVYTDAERIGYEYLLIATGARPKQLPLPGFDLQGVHTLRWIHDAQDIQADADRADKAVVIGGSFIGMEVGSNLQQHGVDTTIIFPEERVWQTFFTPEMSRFFEEYFAEKGVTFAKGINIEKFAGDAQGVTHVVLKSGQELPADIVVAGVGVEPSVSVFATTPLQMDDGIIVNKYLETSAPGVFAVGDVARFPDPIAGRQRRIEHWDNAKFQGQHAARAMLGERTAFRHVAYFFSDVFDLSYEFWGDTSDAATAVHRGSVEEGSFSTWWLDDDDQLVAAFVMDRPEEEREAAQAWIRKHAVLNAETLRTASSLQEAVAVSVD